MCKFSAAGTFSPRTASPEAFKTSNRKSDPSKQFHWGILNSLNVNAPLSFQKKGINNNAFRMVCIIFANQEEVTTEKSPCG
jgi:hypothetical protein